MKNSGKHFKSASSSLIFYFRRSPDHKIACTHNWEVFSPRFHSRARLFTLFIAHAHELTLLSAAASHAVDGPSAPRTREMSVTV